MNEIFTDRQVLAIRSKLWWVACNYTPFLIRMAIYEQTLLIQITDMKVVWVTRIPPQHLLQQKRLYAKSLEIKDMNQLLKLFERLLSKADQQTSYIMTRKKNRMLELAIQKTIQVYPLKWKFTLLDVDQKNIKLICKDIINPLVRTIQAQQTRYQALLKKTKMIQQQLIKKMNQNQKNSYKSPLNDMGIDISDKQCAQFLEGILVQVKQDEQDQEILVDLNLHRVNQYIYQHSCVPNIKGIKKNNGMMYKQLPKKKMNDDNNIDHRPERILTSKSIDRIMRTDQQLVNQLLLHGQQMNPKKKKIDFL